jgi:hypothetical protein
VSLVLTTVLTTVGHQFCVSKARFERVATVLHAYCWVPSIIILFCLRLYNKALKLDDTNNDDNNLNFFFGKIWIIVKK